MVYYKNIPKILNHLFSNGYEFSMNEEDIFEILFGKEGVQNPRDGRIELYELKRLFSKFTKDQKLKNGILQSKTDLKKYYKAVKQNAQSVVMIVSKKLISDAGNDFVRVASQPLRNSGFFGKLIKICDQTNYLNQSFVRSYGTGFFLKKNIIATAAHLIVGPGKEMEDFRFVQGIIGQGESTFKNGILIPRTQVFKIDEDYSPTAKYHSYSKIFDWALVKVRPLKESSDPTFPKHLEIENRIPKPVNSKNKRELLYSIGHGLGLPMKISFDGEVIRVKDEFNSFECTLTLLGGNSGSPVFYADSHELAGLYMGGINKWQKNLCDTCNHLDVCQICVEINNKPILFEGQECQTLKSLKKAIKRIS